MFSTVSIIPLFPFRRQAVASHTHRNPFSRKHGASKNSMGPAERGCGAAGWWYFLSLRSISNFTYEMSQSFREKSHGRDFRKHRARCPLFPTRSVWFHIPISLVKSDWKLRRKIPPPSRPPPSFSRPHGILWSAMLSLKRISMLHFLPTSFF